MRRFIFLIIAASIVVPAAMATTTCPSGGYNLYSPQAVGTLAGSITCATNALTFSEFQFASSAAGGASQPTAASINVTPLQTLGNEGFSFNPAFSVSSNQTQDATIFFEVTAAPGDLISDLFIFFNGASSGTGSTNFSETYCTISFSLGCTTFSVPDAGQISKHIDIAGVTHLFITKDFVATGGTNGSASISLVQNNYSNATPEPSALVLFGSGLLGLAGVIRRKLSI